MRTPARPGQEQRGVMVVGAIVLVALLFFMGTVMALSVESSLHTIGVIAAQDGVNYAAESAVSRGLAAAAASSPCPASGLLGTHSLLTGCYTVGAVSAAPGAVQQWGVPGQPLNKGIPACLTRLVDLQLAVDPSSTTFWMAIGWQDLGTPAGNLQVWLSIVSDPTPGCQNQDVLCPRTMVAPRVVYFACSVTLNDEANVRIANLGGPVQLLPFVVRAAPAGPDSVTTVVGQSGIEVDEADLLLRSGLNPTLALWHSVQP